MTCHRKQAKFLATVLGAATLAAWSVPVRGETVRVRNIRVSETAGDTAVTIATSARPTFTTWKLEQPARVVVELSGARLSDLDLPMDAGTYAVGLVSASVTEDEGAGPRTRIVLTLRQAADYRVESKGNEITLRVAPRVRPTPAETPQARAQAEALARNATQARERAEERVQSETQAKTEAQAQAKAETQAKLEAQAKLKAESQAKAEAEAKYKAEIQAKLEAQAKLKVEAQAKADAEAKYRAEIQAKLEAQAKLKAEAQAKTEAEAKYRAEAQAKAEAEAKYRAATQAKTETEAAYQAKLKAEARARTEAEAKYQAEAQAKRETQAKLEAAALAKAEAQARADAQAKAKAEAQAKADAQAKDKAEAQAKAEALAQAKAEAQARANAQAELAARAKAEAQALTEAQRNAETELKAESKERLAAQATAEQHQRGEAAAKVEADRLRQELAAAQRETAKARAEASAATEEGQRQKLSLARAEVRAKEAQAEAEKARQRADLAQAEAVSARQHESERNKALLAANEEVDVRQKALDGIARRQEAQQSKLAGAERLVAERESAARTLEAKLADREEELRAARARRDSLARDASAKTKTEAAAALAAAERQRKETAKAATESRKELAQAVAARKQEESRKDAQSKLRRDEESKLEAAIALRKSEERRLAEARSERTRLDAERTQLEGERKQLESARGALLAELQQLKSAVAAAPAPAPAVTPPKGKPSTLASAVPASAPVATHAATPPTKPATVATSPSQISTPSPAPVVARAPATPTTPSNLGRPRSITLRPISRIRSIDFVDEPSHASVIIDVDDGAVFTVERMAGRRLSLRLEHSDLSEGLERNLDATEYLGPVKVITSYRDPALRSTVRVDVDLAEDVPNRVRVDGGRIFWDFQKAQAKAPSLPAVWVPPPAVLFVPGRKVAGYSARFVNGVWVGQAIPPYLIPPGSTTPSTEPSTMPSTPPSITPSAASSTSAAPGAAPAADTTRPSSDSRGSSPPGSGGRFGNLGKKRYTGRRIDLDFKGADIHNILRLLADVGQVNVVVADDVKGDVTIKMRDVPWDQALDVVLRSKGLGSVREGNLLRVAPLSLLEKELEAEIARQKQIADVLPIETRLVGVSYAEATQLQEKARDLLTPRGKVSVDHRTNTLIVSDVPKSLQLVEDLVRNLDTQTSQVTIEARMVEAQTSFSRQIGVQWGGTAFADTTHGNPTGLVFPYNVGIGGGADDTAASTAGLVPGARTGTGAVAGGSPNFLVNMPASTGLGTGAAIGLTLGSVAGAFNLNLRLSAMENTGQIRTLSSPRITTMDNIEARIVQGVSVPVSVVSAMGAQTQFVDAQLSLTVKPHVTNEGTIAMTISVTNNAPDFSNTSQNGTPTIDKKETKTTMLIRDGDTAVIGGIYTRTSSLSWSKVPYLSDIPVVGWFFRSKKELDNRVEFLIFITPRIVNRSHALGQ
jgi:type IV pilus assembly protein PilQ